MKKYLFGLLAIVFAIGAVAFTKPEPAKKDSLRTDYYFKFIGTLNSEENDVTKWELIDATEYGNMTCGLPKNGCKLIANDVQVINLVTRPRAVYVVPLTKNPTTGTYVNAVSNKQN